MTCWSAGQLAAFLGWGDGHSANYPLWHWLANMGMRRDEALALRYRDVDPAAGTVSIRRFAGMVRTAGEGAEVVDGGTKSGRPRVIDLDAATVAVHKAHRRERGSMALQLARDDALVFGDLEGRHRNLEHTRRQFVRDTERCRAGLGDVLPVIRTHDLRYARHDPVWLAGVPVHVVSQRLGHASPTVTLTVTRGAGQPARRRRPVRQADQGGRGMIIRAASVNGVSPRPSGANYKPFTCGNSVSEGRHNP
jgi:integrase